MPRLLLTFIIAPLVSLSAMVPSDALDVETIRPLHLYGQIDPRSLLPDDVTLLADPDTIVTFLEKLDSAPPDWRSIYGSTGEDHMERLFEVNRERDHGRQGNAFLKRRIAFFREGVLTGYDPDSGGFGVAIGPKIISTSWGDVRFKPYGLPSGLIAVPPTELTVELEKQKANGRSVEVDLLLSGRLDASESTIYDFAHEEPGQGMIMPVVHIERIDYFLAR